MKTTLFLAVVFCVVAGCIAHAQPNRICPVVAQSMDVLLGGTVGGKWVSPQKMGPKLRGGERYQLYSLTARLGTGIGRKPTIENPGEYYDLKMSTTVKAKGDVIGVAGSWNAMPRIPRLLSTSQKVYKDAVRNELAKKGLRLPDVTLNQVIRVDLEGDGTDEVVVSATTGRRDYAKTSLPEKGDYSLVLLRKVIGGRVKTIVLAEEVYPKSVDEGMTSRYSIAGVLDLNGDGKMEIILNCAYYEGAGMSAYEVKGGKSTEVIGGGFGA